MKTTALGVLDAYRADAHEREVYLRTLEKQNRDLLDTQAIYLRSILRNYKVNTGTFAVGWLLGYATNGFVLAAADRSVEAMLGYASLGALAIIGAVLSHWLSRRVAP